MPISPINSLSDDRSANSLDSSIPIAALSDVGGGGNEPSKINPVIPTSKVAIVDDMKVKSSLKPQERSKFLKMTTNFRTLKYSSDQPHDGTSYQPYIRTELARGFVEQAPPSYSDNTGLKGIALFDAIDKDRITKFLDSNAKGKLFKDKQKQLAFFNPKMEVGLNYAFTLDTTVGILDKLIPGSGKAGGLEFTRIYNDNINLLQQIGVQGSGIHLDAPGAQSVIPFQNKYEYVVKNKDADTNRLVLLFNNKIVDTSFKNLLTTPNLADMNKTGIARGQNKIFEYLGGPGASDQNSMTVIGRYDYTTDWKAFSAYTSKKQYQPTGNKLVYLTPRASLKKIETTDANGQTLQEVVVALAKGAQPGEIITKLETPSAFDPSNDKHSLSHKAYVTSSFDNDNATRALINRSRAMAYDQIAKTGQAAGTTPSIMDDFRIAASGLGATYGYTDSNMIQKNLIGDPGSPVIKRVSYDKVGVSTQDYPTNNAGIDGINSQEVGTDASKSDLIKCVITAVETQQTSANVIVPLTFRAFVTNFSDNINANYDTHQYVGRGENFYTYKNAERKVSFQLAIAAQSRSEMKPLYRKLNYLISQLYPGYSGFVGGTGIGFMRAPLIKMTIGDYLYDQPGFLNSINLTIPNDSPWEIVYDPIDKDKDMYQLPHHLVLNINFTPIHNFIAKRSHKSATLPANNSAAAAAGTPLYSITPFITPNDTSNKFEIGKV